MDIKELAAQLKEVDAVPAINQDNKNRDVDDLPVIVPGDNTSSLNDRKTCTKCRKGRLRRRHRNLIEKVSFVKRKYVCDYCEDGVYIRRFNGN